VGAFSLKMQKHFLRNILGSVFIISLFFPCMANLITYLGLVAAILTTASFLPQVVKSWKTKKTGDVSIGMYSVLVIGVILWLVYGILIKDLPLILANILTLIFTFFVLCLKIKYG
jgi:MtN3 and saliva related transmembrane protein